MKKISLTVMAATLIVFLIAGCAAVEIIGGPVSADTLKDGVYEGNAKSGSVKVTVNVTIKDQRIADIELVNHRNMKGKPAEGVIPDRIIAEQSTKVDAVSGATWSSTAIMNAVEDALRKAS